MPSPREPHRVIFFMKPLKLRHQKAVGFPGGPWRSGFPVLFYSQFRCTSYTIFFLVKKPKPLMSRHPECLLTLLSLLAFTFQHLFLSVSEAPPLAASVTSSFFVQACVPLPDDLVHQQEQKYTVTLCYVDQMRFLS